MQEEPAIDVSVRLSLDPPATLFLVPIETVSESEEGLERTYQGLGLVCLWSVAASRSSTRRAAGWSSRLRWDIAPSRAATKTR